MDGSYTPWFHEIQFTVYGIPSAPAQVTVDGASIQDFHYDSAHGVVTAVVPFHLPHSQLEIQY
jgi:hypothetical protein